MRIVAFVGDLVSVSVSVSSPQNEYLPIVQFTYKHVAFVLSEVKRIVAAIVRNKRSIQTYELPKINIYIPISPWLSYYLQSFVFLEKYLSMCTDRSRCRL